MSEPQVPEHLRPIEPRTRGDEQAVATPPPAGATDERLEPFSATHERPPLPT